MRNEVIRVLATASIVALVTMTMFSLITPTTNAYFVEDNYCHIDADALWNQWGLPVFVSYVSSNNPGPVYTNGEWIIHSKITMSSSTGAITSVSIEAYAYNWYSPTSVSITYQRIDAYHRHAKVDLVYKRAHWVGFWQIGYDYYHLYVDIDYVAEPYGYAVGVSYTMTTAVVWGLF